MTHKIFLNYRRDDLDGYAENIKAMIEAEFGQGMVFLDKQIKYSEPWPERIQQALDFSLIVLSLIGDKWFKLRDDQDLRPRIDNAGDWVRREIEEALAKRKIIIPVLIDANHLHFQSLSAYPKDSTLSNIRNLQAVFLTKRDFADDVRKLLNALAEQPGMVKPKIKIEPKEVPFDPLQYLPLPADLADKMPPERAPYVGLRPFTREDAAIFFGRNQNILELHNRISEGRRLILLYGPSGVGKSSLLFAGLFPRLESDWVRYYRRRNKETGLGRDLASIIEAIRLDTRPALVILDQVEEMLTDPNPAIPDEATVFAGELAYALDQFSHLQVILGFRSDYYVDIDNLLYTQRLVSTKYQVKPLDRTGILEAIIAVTHSPLNTYFDLRIIEGVENVLAGELAKDASSPVAPLLQAQLRLLWDNALARRTADFDAVIFDKSLVEQYSQKNLAAFLDNQLAKLKDGNWQDALQNGWVLDLLFYFTTSRGTAASHAEPAVLSVYPQSNTLALIEVLKNLYLLNKEPNTKENILRLTHDALAPVVRERYNDSDLPAQRASRILESKRKDIAADRPVNFSDSDVQAIREARPWMQQLDEKEEKALQKSEAEALQKEEALRVKNQFQYETLRDNAYQLIYNLDHEKSFTPFIGALNAEVPTLVKTQELSEGLQELIYFLAEAGKFESARQAAGLLDQLMQSRMETTQALQHCRLNGWNETALFRQFFEEHFPNHFTNLKRRYYPEMVIVEGGQFWMGDNKRQWSKPVHKTRVNGIKIAKTMCTFYQYSLYCVSTGLEDIADHSPPWGRQGPHPLVSVRWYEAVRYANWLSEQLGFTPAYLMDEKKKDPNNKNKYDWMQWTIQWQKEANGFRLPTEAEWEWAARGGTLSQGFVFSGSNTADEVAWHEANSPKGTQPVKQLLPNELGIYDMSGNAWEWCWDWFQERYYRRFR